MNLRAYCYGNPLNLYGPDRLWVVRPDWMLTNGEIGDALNDGFFATLDGAIPFWDPFTNSGRYGRCESGVGVSQAAGGIARDAALSALVPNIGAWAKNPVMYELGSTTVPTRLFNMISHLDPVSRGRILTLMNGGGLGGMARTAFGTSWKYVGGNLTSTLSTGLTPGGYLLSIGLIKAVDSISNSNECK